MWAFLAPILSSILAGGATAMISNAGNRANMDAMNAYNAPAAQMQRYGAAGLNPNLIYSQGTPGNQTSAVQFASPDIDPVKIWSMTQAMKESKQRIAESKVRAELHSTRQYAQSLLNAVIRKKYEAESPYFFQNAKYSADMLQQRFKTEVARTATEAGRGGLTDIDRKIREQIKERQGYELEGLRTVKPEHRAYFDILMKLLHGSAPYVR